MKRVFVLSALLIAANPAVADDEPWVLAPNSIGPLRIGQNVEVVERYLHTKLGYTIYENRGCSTLITKELAPLGITYTIEAKLLTRINVDFYANDPRPRSIKTAAGIGLGSTEEDLLKAYPNARIKPNQLDPSWHTIFVDTPERTHALVFETNGKTVKSMRSGLIPNVNPPSACN